MRKFATFLMVFFLFTAFSADAMTPRGNRSHRHQKHEHHGGKNTVGAPLDGSLLAILGVAGAVYYVVRKKRIVQEA
jgi:hypothetical protein